MQLTFTEWNLLQLASEKAKDEELSEGIHATMTWWAAKQTQNTPLLRIFCHSNQSRKI